MSVASDNNCYICGDITACPKHYKPKRANVQAPVDSTADWREQAYEDQYWAERDQANAEAVSTWKPETMDLFLAAVEEQAINRATHVADVKASLLS